MKWGKLINRWHDEGRTAHLLKPDGSPACGVPYYFSGGAIADQTTINKCRRCKRIEEKKP